MTIVIATIKGKHVSATVRMDGAIFHVVSNSGYYLNQSGYLTKKNAIAAARRYVKNTDY